MKAFINIGQHSKVSYKGVVLYGQVKDGFLYNDNGVQEIPEGATVEVQEVSLPTSASQFLTEDPQTLYEVFQKQRHGNFVKECGTPDDYEDYIYNKDERYYEGKQNI